MKFGDWINRKRHNRGFGIQSPSAFFFITQVLKERLPYYAYPAIDKVAKEQGGISAGLARELFRIANYCHCSNCIAIESPAAACAMSAAHPLAVQYHIAACRTAQPATKELLEENCCRELAGNVTELLATTARKIGGIGMLYIGDCDKRDDVYRKALQYTSCSSVIIVEGIHRKKETLDWWNKVVASNDTVVTYDMYSYGLLFFDPERKKQHYRLKR